MTQRPRILITCDTFGEVIDFAREHFELVDSQGRAQSSPAELRERLQGMDGVLVAGTDRIDAALLDASPAVRAVSIAAVGYNSIDIAACNARGVLATNTPGILDDTTADLGFALILAASRRLGEGERYLRAGHWKRWENDLLLGQDVHHRTLGIVGMGRIGQALARRAGGFDMPVVYHNRNRVDSAIETRLAARWLPLDELFATADVVCLCLPYSAAAHHLVNAALLARMKPTAVLVNIARGGIVDENALIDALRERRIAAAGLDVYEGEPSINPGLLDLDNAVLVPHIGSATRATRVAMGLCAARNLKVALEGGVPPNLINPEALAQSAGRRG
jgi:gluconate 2-dehydrogenase